MLLYEHTWRNNYDEIKTWYPVWYGEFPDMDALWRVFGKKLDEIQTDTVQALDNTFIQKMDARTASDWEKFLYIPHDSTRTLDDRRNLVDAHIIGGGHIGRKEIIEVMRLFADGDIDVAFAKGIIYIKINRIMTGHLRLNDSVYILLKKIPAHLKLWFIYSIKSEQAKIRVGAHHGMGIRLAIYPQLTHKLESVPGSTAYAGATTQMTRHIKVNPKGEN